MTDSDCDQYQSFKAPGNESTMYKFEEICELIKIVGSSGLARVEIEHAGTRVCFEGKSTVEVAAPTVAAPSVAVQAGPASAPETTAVAMPEDDHHIVTSPIVGTFYRAPSPDAEPFVRVGDFVEKGQVMCIVEAMKLMNEIECEQSGTVVKIFQENESPVEYGQQLFSLSSD